jgi:hypothetical protein
MADGIVGESGRDSSAEAETATKATGYIVLAATLPDLEVARCVDATLAGIEAEHDFAEAEAVPAAR